MPKKATYGPVVKVRTLRLFEALLSYARNEILGCDHLRDKLVCREETSTPPKLVIETKLRVLEELTEKDKYEGSLSREQIQEAIRQLRDFLGILTDNRLRTQGSEKWHFTITLWSQDKAKNLLQFQEQWEQKRPDKSKQQEGISISPSVSTLQKSDSELELYIGLSSESSQSIAKALEEFEYITNAFLPESYPRLKFNIKQLKNDQARHDFCKPDAYDIIMLDDPWVPAYFNAIQPLDDEPFFQKFLKEKRVSREDIFGQIFHESFHRVCIYNGKIIGLPVLGNVHSFIHRLDVQEKIEKLTKEAVINRELPYLNLKAIQEFHDAVKAKFTPLRICDDIDSNGGIDVFWEILRAFNHQDIEVRNGAIVIGLDKARDARSWMYRFTDRTSFDKLTASLIAEKQDIAAALGWPGWLSETLSKDLPITNTVQLQRFTKHPLMGLWSLCLPKKPKSESPKIRKYSIQVILALTTDSFFQLLLAQRGNIPVLKNFTKVEELKKHPFWDLNYSTIRDSLAYSRPRPRTEHWNNIEYTLSMQIRTGAFEDVPGLLIFE